MKHLSLSVKYIVKARGKKESDGKTAILIEGARRIGKSTVVEEFAKMNMKAIY